MSHVTDVDYEEEKEQKHEQKRHVVFDHRAMTCVFSLVLFLVIELLVTLITDMAGIDGFLGKVPLMRAVCIVSAVLMCLFFELRFRGQFEGMFKWSGRGLLLIAPCLLLAWANIYDLVDLVFDGGQISSVPMSLFMAAAAGISEEVVFRGVPACNWMRVARGERDILRCTIFTSLVFGLVHGTNALAGAALSASLFQMFYAACLGILFCAVLLRTGSIWPLIIMHTFIDFTAFLGIDLSHAGLLTEGLTIDMEFFVTLQTALAVAAWGLYLIRPEKRPEIVALWDKKWHKA